MESLINVVVRMVKHDPGILWRSVRTCDMRWTPNYSWDRRSAIVGERVNRNTSRL